MESADYKKCTQCKQDKELSTQNFWINRAAKDGFNSVCKQCTNKWIPQTRVCLCGCGGEFLEVDFRQKYVSKAHRNQLKNREYSKARPDVRKKFKKQWMYKKIAKNRAMLVAAKSRPCHDCGVIYPYYVMDFDHISDKRFVISAAVNKSTAVLEQEMSKCEVVCANCHRIRTYMRRMAYAGCSKVVG